jgi:hypothetical protein
MMVFDIDGTPEKSGESSFNQREFLFIRTLVYAMLKAGVSPEDIGLLTPYQAQYDKFMALVPRVGGIDPRKIDGY